MATTGAAPVAVIINRASGWDEEKKGLHVVESALPGARLEVVGKGVNISDLARRAVESGAGRVAAGGGDGTIRAAAEALAGTGAALGILPVGTLNHFARDLEIPLELEQAAAVVRDGAVREVDVAEANGRVFINNAIIGLYPAYRTERARAERFGWRGALAILQAAWRILHRYPTMRVRMSIDGKEVVRRTPFVLVANNEHQMDGFRLGARERLDTGRLWVYVMRKTGRAGLLRSILSVFIGRFRRHREFEVFPASAVTVHAGRRRVRVSLDGEILKMKGPLEFRTRPRALRVIVPPKAA